MTRWKQFWAGALCLAMLLSSAAATEVSDSFQTRSSLDDTKSLTIDYQYADSWFQTDPAQENPALAMMSMILAAAPYGTEDNWSQSAEEILTKLEFSNIQTSDEMDGDPLIGCVFARKTINNTVLTVIIPRGRGYGEEFGYNLELNPVETAHAGFQQAADQVKSWLASYENGQASGKYWITGYSRAAAVSNLLAASLTGGNCFAYCFATPNTVLSSAAPNAESFSYIHNYLLKHDLVTMLPPAPEFTRYGTVHALGTEDKWDEIENWLTSLDDELSYLVECGNPDNFQQMYLDLEALTNFYNSGRFPDPRQELLQNTSAPNPASDSREDALDAAMKILPEYTQLLRQSVSDLSPSDMLDEFLTPMEGRSQEEFFLDRIQALSEGIQARAGNNASLTQAYDENTQTAASALFTFLGRTDSDTRFDLLNQLLYGQDNNEQSKTLSTAGLMALYSVTDQLSSIEALQDTVQNTFKTCVTLLNGLYQYSRNTSDDSRQSAAQRAYWVGVFLLDRVYQLGLTFSDENGNPVSFENLSEQMNNVPPRPGSQPLADTALTLRTKAASNLKSKVSDTLSAAGLSDDASELLALDDDAWEALTDMLAAGLFRLSETDVNAALEDTSVDPLLAIARATLYNLTTMIGNDNFRTVAASHAPELYLAWLNTQAPEPTPTPDSSLTPTPIPTSSGGGGGGGGGGGSSRRYTVTVDSAITGGVITPDSTSVYSGDTVTLTIVAEQGYTLKAGSVKVLDDNKKETGIALTDKGSGVYTFKMPRYSVIVTAEFEGSAVVTPPPSFSTNPFSDILPEHYYYNPVLWAYQRGITLGFTDTTFLPNRNCTRANAVTFLWRSAGSPEPSGTVQQFSDVAVGTYYEKAVLWATEKGITVGTTATTFSPDDTCNRAQIVTFLYRFASTPPVDPYTIRFTDVTPGGYYENAVAWAADKQITLGNTPTTFNPYGDCLRGQIVTFLYRYYSLPEYAALAPAPLTTLTPTPTPAQ